MDTVSMLNTMRFYCQPILPLVYDESMSYYETLCKVVGQLNTTGETVNKLNEGLTGEISDRQAADAALDARIKEIEETNRKMHFLKLDTLGHLLTPDLTREKLSQWVQDGDLIVMLYAPDELENSWAVATSYRCLGATGADTMQLNFYVPISIVNNAGKSGSDVAQEVVVISLPTGALTNQWVVRTITTTIPDTNADGFVNLTATVGDAGAVTCDVEPGAIVEALRNYFSGTNQYAVAVNARLNYDGKQYHSGAATVKADAPGAGNIRIVFDNYWDGVRAENGVRQTTNTTVFLVGDVKNNAWSVETIGHKTFDFSRYEGFQFTRGANNVITTNDESTPNAVYAQYHSDTSGKLYQNLPTRLIDTVDGAEYWNGTFDIYGGNHMSFTFVTSNYATSSDKMLVRVIELSADVGTTAWMYGVKEFTLPLSGGGSAPVYVDFWATAQDEVYDKDLKAWTISLGTSQTFDAIFDLISSGADVVARLYKDSTKAELVAKSIEAQLSGDKTLGNINFLFMRAASDVFLGFSTIADAIWVTKTANSTSAYALYKWCALPVPAGDSTDSGKVPTVNGTAWELKTPTGGSSNAVLYTPQTLTDEQKKQARMNVDAAGEFVVTATVNQQAGTVSVDKTYTEVRAAASNGKRVTMIMPGIPISESETVDIFLPLVYCSRNEVIFSNALGDIHGDGGLYSVIIEKDEAGASLRVADAVTTVNGVMQQVRMSYPPTQDDNIATKKYVDDGLNEKLSTQGGEISASLEVGQTVSAGGAVSVGRTSADTGIHFEKAASDAGRISHGSDAMSGVAPIARLKVGTPTEADDATTKGYVDNRAVRYDGAQELTEAQQFQARKNINATGPDSPQFKGYVTLTPATETEGVGVGLSPTKDGNNFALDIADVNEGAPTKLTGVKTPTDTDTNAAATVEYVLAKAGGGAPITIKLGTGNAATSTATFAEIKATLEAGKAPILDSAPGTVHWFALNWQLNGSSSLSIQYGTFDVVGGGAASFSIYDVGVSSSGITYAMRQFTTE